MSSAQSLVTNNLVLSATVLALCIHAKANDSMCTALPAAANSIEWQGT